MKKIEKQQRLVLHKERIRRLDDAQLITVNGGLSINGDSAKSVDACTVVSRACLAE